MFGSKLRSWMENHIVRPRKKGNKNKNNGTSNLAPSTTSNGHKGTSFQGDSSSAIASPARRSEVSPIQNHKSSRAGWHSPQDNDMSSKLNSDEYPYRHTVKSSSPKKMIHKSSYTLEKTTSASSTNHLHPNYQQYSKSADHKKFTRPTDQQAYMHHTGTDPIDTRQSNIHHFRQNNYCYSNTNTSNHPQSSTSSTVTIEPKPIQYERVPMMDQSHHQTMTNSTAAGKQIIKENHFSAKGLSGRGCGGGGGVGPTVGGGGIDAMAKSNKFEHEKVAAARKRDEYQSDAISDGKCFGKQSHENAEHLYGRIQSRTFSTSSSTNGGCETSSSVCGGNYDRCNANVQLKNGTKRCDNSNGVVMNCVNNNHYDGRQSQQFSHHNGNHNNNNNNLSDSFSIDKCASNNKAHPGQAISSTIQTNIRLSSGEKNRNMLRTNRYSNGSHLTAPGTHQLAHMINTLSSPESAYSTGYSTDGTSPGATYTPEYYINMRTGTHYFPRGVSSVVEQSRHKFGLNKIDEATGAETNSHRRTESCDSNRRPLNGGTDVIANGHVLAAKANFNSVVVSTGLSPDLQRRLALQNYKGMESPSPRQRCRIRTNPWFQAIDPTCIVPNSNNSKRIDMDTSSTSSGIKSSSDAGTDDKNGKKIVSSESESSSSTEIDLSKKLFTPNTIRRRRELVRNETKSEKSTHAIVTLNQPGDSDEDATLNEMMGKFDESYCYEKETDILSDSDPTECISDLDTGQDGGDECDTDELLDIDFIDNGSIQEIIDKNLYENTGSCSYVPSFASEKRLSRTRRSQKQIDESGSGKRRKRLTRTRKRSGDNSCNGRIADELSAIPCGRVRESKSLNGTPVSLRRNKSGDAKCKQKITPLANRCNSLTFTEIHSIRSRFLAIAESEKALIKADLEADVKYKQLIHEAETILVSMKTTTTSSTARETPVPSPRRIPALPTNKRVEMLRNCETDLRRELAKASESNKKLTNEPLCADAPLSGHQDNLLMNKRIEILRFETSSAPNSPKSGRFSPRKTHVSNFICQNASPTDLLRRKNSSENGKSEHESTACSQFSPQLHLNGRKMLSPPKSPTPRRRFRSQSQSARAHVTIESDSDSDGAKSIGQNGCRKPAEVNGNKENVKRKNVRKSSAKGSKGDDAKTSQKIDELDVLNRNLELSDVVGTGDTRTKPPMLSFRSIDMGNKSPEIFYCPQSEPLKRKIYSGSKTLEKLQQTLDMDPEISKKALLNKISLLRRDRKAAQMDVNEANGYTHHDGRLEPSVNDGGESVGYNTKRQLILNTIADLKRSLEDQSVELCGLNDDGVEE
ncbi:serine-rich adhesin for platelets isoform X2 [Bradysia coprophila]|uniref:serine-rich adhesin for platelets isoform X2 n=1 Tax=Bradysia coprophila TaxID=38358 RepID=UPI00187DB709|nr:serine-rich adhesin for platelets isoform X2 [Bradysia coprophila]